MIVTQPIRRLSVLLALVSAVLVGFTAGGCRLQEEETTDLETAEQAVQSGKGLLMGGQQAPDQVDQEQLKEIVRELEIGTADEGAEEFVAANEDKIKAILQQLVAQGKI